MFDIIRKNKTRKGILLQPNYNKVIKLSLDLGQYDYMQKCDWNRHYVNIYFFNSILFLSDVSFTFNYLFIYLSCLQGGVIYLSRAIRMSTPQ